MNSEEMNLILNGASESIIDNRVENVLALAAAAGHQNPDSGYLSFFSDDEEILVPLRKRAKFKDISLDDLDEVLKECSEALMKRLQESGEKQRNARSVYPRKCRVYDVCNTAERLTKILAIDVQSARYHAVQNRHIQDEKNGRVMVYNDEWHEKEMKSGSALGRAIIEGHQGVLKKIGDKIIIEARDKVFLPLSIVD